MRRTCQVLEEKLGVRHPPPRFAIASIAGGDAVAVRLEGSRYSCSGSSSEAGDLSICPSVQPLFDWRMKRESEGGKNFEQNRQKKLKLSEYRSVKHMILLAPRRGARQAFADNNLLETGTVEGPAESQCSLLRVSQAAPPETVVREQNEFVPDAPSLALVPSRLAHSSNRLVAQLNSNWRVVDDPLQWILQRRKGNPRKKNSGWRDRSFCTTREGLLQCVRESCGEVDGSAVGI